MPKFLSTLGSIFTLVAGIAIAAMPAQAALPTHTNLGGPMPSTTSLWAVLLTSVTDDSPARAANIDRLAKFTEDEKQILQNVFAHPDAHDKAVYYTVIPFRLTRDWDENKLYLNFKAVSRIAEGLDDLGDLDLKSLKTITKLSAENLSDKDKAAVIEAQFSGISAAVKSVFVELVRTQARALNLGDIGVDDFKTALKFASLALNVPVAQATFSIAPSYSEEKSDAILKFIKEVPELVFYSMTDVTKDSVWTLSAPKKTSPSVSSPRDDSERALRDSFDVLSATNNRTLTQALAMNLNVANVGTVITVDLYYNLVAGWGDTPTEYGPKAVFPFPGVFSTQKQLSLALDGKVICKFRAEIKYGSIIDLTKQDAYAIIDGTKELAGNRENIDMAMCILYDDKGVAISDDNGAIMVDKIPDEIGKSAASARLLSTLLQTKILAYKNSFSQEYQAAQSLKNDIIAATLHRADGWKNLPIPTLTDFRHRWESNRQCVQIPQRGECLRNEDYWEWHGFSSSVHSRCVQWATRYDSSCRDVESLINYSVQVPIAVRYIDKIDFNRILDETKEYPFAYSDTLEFTLFAGNDIFPTRKLISGSGANREFRRTEGDISVAVGVKTSLTADAPAIQPPADAHMDPTAGHVSGNTAFDPFANH